MTNIASELAKKYGTVKAEPNLDIMPQFMLDTAGAMRWKMPDITTAEEQAKLYARLSWIRSAVDVKANTAALQGFNVKKREGEDLTDIPNHPFELLLEKPNPLNSKFEFLRDAVSYSSINKNAYWWLNRTSPDMEPLELWNIPTWRIVPVPDEKQYILGYAYDPGTGKEPVMLPTWQVVHFKGFNPLNEFVGLSALESVGMVSVTDIKLQEWLMRFYGTNNARLPGILAFKEQMANDLAWQKIKDDVEHAAETRNFMMLRGVGDRGVEWMKAASTSEEMQQIAQRELTKEEIFSVIAPGYASTIAVNATEASSKTGKQTLLEFAIWPELVPMAQKITLDILPVYGEDLVGEFDDPRQTDRLLELQEQDKYSETHTVDEIRQEYYQDKPMGDERGELLLDEIGKGKTKAEAAETPSQLLPFTGQDQEPDDEPEQDEPDNGMTDETKADLAVWRRKSTKALKAGKGAGATFTSDHIAPELHARIWSQLSACKSAEAVRDVFDNAIKGDAGSDEPELVQELKRANDLLEKIHKDG